MFKFTAVTRAKFIVGVVFVLTLAATITLIATYPSSSSAAAADADSLEEPSVEVRLFEYDNYSKELKSNTSRFRDHVIELKPGETYYFLDAAPEGVQLRFFQIRDGIVPTSVTTGVVRYTPLPSDDYEIKIEMPMFTTIVVKEDSLF